VQRRPSIPFAVAVTALVLLLAVGMAAWRYQPLRQVGEVTTGPDALAATVPEFEEAGATILNYVDGDYVTYAVTLRNSGPVGVRVTGLPLPDAGERRLLQPVAVGLSTGGSDDAAGVEPLTPFRLGAGEQRTVVVQARFDHCEYYTERAIDVIDSQTVQFRVAGIPRTATLQLVRPLLVRSPTIQGCDARTLDRSEHRRTDP